MEDKESKSADNRAERPSPAKKEYHSPEMTTYGDVRELTLTNPNAGGRDQFSELTAPT